jgi:hypothetical protein
MTEELQIIEDAILAEFEHLDIRKYVEDGETSYRYEANKRVKLDEHKTIGSLLTYSVYGKTRLEAAQKLLRRLKEDEEEFEQLRQYYSIKDKDIDKTVQRIEFGNYAITIKEINK